MFCTYVYSEYQLFALNSIPGKEVHVTLCATNSVYSILFLTLFVSVITADESQVRSMIMSEMMKQIGSESMLSAVSSDMMKVVQGWPFATSFMYRYFINWIFVLYVCVCRVFIDCFYNSSLVVLQ